MPRASSWTSPDRRAWMCAGLCTTLLAACGLPAQGDAGPAASGESEVIGGNGLTINGLTTNGLTTNGLTTNGLTTNGLTTNGLAPALLAALRDKTSMGVTTRMFFRYLVSCALPAGRGLTFSWTDASGVAHDETASGQFNLAPAWETGPVDVAGQELVSACLFARTNALGLSVPISIRGATDALAVTSSERGEFHYGEGAFWGNLFSGQPYGRSCSRAPFDAGSKTSGDIKNGRVCASRDCGIIHYVGPCFTSAAASSGQACFRKAANNDWVSDCSYYMSTSKATNPHVITTWLRP